MGVDVYRHVIESAKVFRSAIFGTVKKATKDNLNKRDSPIDDLENLHLFFNDCKDELAFLIHCSDTDGFSQLLRSLNRVQEVWGSAVTNFESRIGEGQLIIYYEK